MRTCKLQDIIRSRALVGLCTSWQICAALFEAHMSPVIWNMA